MQRKFVLLLAIFLFGSFPLVRAQELELSFYNKLSALITEKEPDWKLHRKAILQNQLIIQWVNGQHRALIYIAFLPSEDMTQDHLRTSLKRHEQMPESNFSKLDNYVSGKGRGQIALNYLSDSFPP